MEVTTYLVTATCRVRDLKSASKALRWGVMHLCGPPIQEERDTDDVSGDAIYVQKYMFDSDDARKRFIKRVRSAPIDPDIVYFELTHGKRWKPDDQDKAE